MKWMTAKLKRKIRSLLWKNGLFYFLGLLVVYGIKLQYSRASSDDLIWILGPTAEAVEWMSSIRFEREALVGYISLSTGVIIAPACAGVNFLIVAFCTTFFSFVHRLKNWYGKLMWTGFACLGAYVLAVMVNALRIILSIHLYNIEIYNTWLTPERVHRLEGILLYVILLCLFHAATNKIMGWYMAFTKDGDRQVAKGVKFLPDLTYPLLWYCMVAMGIPFMNGAFQNRGSIFLEHCLAISSVCVVVFMSLFLIRWRIKNL